MVLKSRVPNKLVQLMMVSPYKCIDHDLFEEELAKCSEAYRRMHTLRKFIDEKIISYEQTLIDQYLKQGYAKDKTEVTGDNEEK
ncbi:hypothetical protein E2562_005200 [Oryza meyeriana var. granulata]|uniref:Uncharacterized protein n=1 Tax=Oryza meyeriana var. granulata TaxID=110450 RepID=A0A6G1BRZ3_9ORYZ|nr:hypothetical protein E2562_005200 [Oryza meyeriana var. granulata]